MFDLSVFFTVENVRIIQLLMLNDHNSDTIFLSFFHNFLPTLYPQSRKHFKFYGFHHKNINSISLFDFTKYSEN